MKEKKLKRELSGNNKNSDIDSCLQNTKWV